MRMRRHGGVHPITALISDYFLGIIFIRAVFVVSYLFCDAGGCAVCLTAARGREEGGNSPELR